MPHHLNPSMESDDSCRSITQWQKKMPFLENDHSMLISNMNSQSLKIQLVFLQILQSQHLSPAVVSLQKTVPRTKQGHPPQHVGSLSQTSNCRLHVLILEAKSLLDRYSLTSSPFLEAFLLSSFAGSVLFTMMAAACAFDCCS